MDIISILSLVIILMCVVFILILVGGYIMNKFHKSLMISALAAFTLGFSVTVSAMAPVADESKAVLLVEKPAEKSDNAIAPAAFSKGDRGEEVENIEKPIAVKKEETEALIPPLTVIADGKKEEVVQEQKVAAETMKAKIVRLLESHAKPHAQTAADGLKNIGNALVQLTTQECKEIAELASKAYYAAGNERQGHIKRLIEKFGIDGLILVLPLFADYLGLFAFAEYLASCAGLLLYYPGVTCLGLAALIKGGSLAAPYVCKSVAAGVQKIKGKFVKKNVVIV
jgi:hypothetical protein